MVGLGGCTRRHSDSGGFYTLRRLPFDANGPEQGRPFAGWRIRQSERLGPWIQLFRRAEECAPYRERVSADAARSAICLKMPTRSLVTIDRDDGLLHFPAIGR